MFDFVITFVFREYGKWVARNPTLVLGLSLTVVLLLCLGLIRFKVETRPEKVSNNFLDFVQSELFFVTFYSLFNTFVATNTFLIEYFKYNVMQIQCQLVSRSLSSLHFYSLGPLFLFI